MANIGLDEKWHRERKETCPDDYAGKDSHNIIISEEEAELLPLLRIKIFAASMEICFLSQYHPINQISVALVLHGSG